MEGETIKFEAEETRKDLSIIIVDDEALEELEYFNVRVLMKRVWTLIFRK